MSTKTTEKLILCELEDPGMAGLESLSPFCLKAHRALTLAGLAHAHDHGARPSDFRSYNPTGQVPVLLEDGAPICDSTAILRRVVDLAPGAFDAGADERTLGERWLWEEMADSVLNGYLVAARWADDRNWPGVSKEYFGKAPWIVQKLVAPRIRARVVGGLVARDVWRRGPEACWQRFTDTLNHLEARAPREGYWLGPTPGVADVAMFGQLASFRTPLTVWQAQELEKRPRLVDWLDRVDAVTLRDGAPLDVSPARLPGIVRAPARSASTAREAGAAPG